jgi:hypothetical protein
VQSTINKAKIQNYSAESIEKFKKKFESFEPTMVEEANW